MPFGITEVFSAISKAVIDYKNNGLLPQKINRDTLLGPMQMSKSNPEISLVTLQDVYDLANKTNQHISTFGFLPSYLEVQNLKIGTGAL